MLTDVCHDGRTLADPGIAADRDARPEARLFADGDVEPFDTVLAAAIDDRDMGADQHIILERHVADGAEESDVNFFADLRRRMREDRTERETASRPAAGQDQPIEGPAEVDPARGPGSG